MKDMPANRTVLALPGDGIGPEVFKQVTRVIDWFDKRRAVRFDIKTELVGGASLHKHGEPSTHAGMQAAMTPDAVPFGSGGGPKWDNLEFRKQPEPGLLRLRKEIGLFAHRTP